jgi:hypothetical protein
MHPSIAAIFTSPRLPLIVLGSLAGLAVAGAAALAAVGVAGRPQEKVAIHVYKTPTCGCCSKWVDHLEANGFAVETTDLEDLGPVKAKYGVPTDLGSCHTAVANGYAIEGHVPAGDIARMLEERPKIAGIAVPSMPAGSPGMEVPSGRVQPYRVIAFDKDGNARVYSSHGGR